MVGGAESRSTFSQVCRGVGSGNLQRPPCIGFDSHRTERLDSEGQGSRSNDRPHLQSNFRR